MTSSLLPADFEDRVQSAIRIFWSSREKVATNRKQGGSRDKVVAGKNMDGFIDLVDSVASHCGMPAGVVRRGKGKATLPGYFRATKDWDAVVVNQGRLLAVFEFKSHVGSLGNNLNNRCEEAVGSAADLWVAHNHGAYGRRSPLCSDLEHEFEKAEAATSLADPRPPFVGWLMLLEESERSQRRVKCSEPHYPVFDEFKAASYARRYQILCERLVERHFYSAAALELSVSSSETSRSLSGATSIRNLFAEFAGKLLAAKETL
jgi:hypothetical protein